MARTKQGLLNKSDIKQKFLGVEGHRKFYSDGMNGLLLSVDRRSGSPVHSFYFECKLNGRTIRYKLGKYELGDNSPYTVELARREAVEATRSVNKGLDPRAVKEENLAAGEATRLISRAGRVTLEEIWNLYLDSRALDIRPLSPLTVRDYRKHLNKSFAELRSKPIKEIDKSLIQELYPKLVLTKGAAQANQAMRSLSAVLNWAIASEQFSRAMSTNPVATLAKKMHKVKARENALERGQINCWWTASDGIENGVGRNYLRFLLLTGARREEALSLRWEDLDLKWNTCIFRNTKNGDDRIIPLTKYVAELILDLPKKNQWVFYSATSSDGRFREPAKCIAYIKTVTGLNLSSHDLRRSFATLSEWAELPDGAIKQIIGHKPNGVTEMHYKRRSIDLLRSMLQRYEDFVLGEISG